MNNHLQVAFFPSVKYMSGNPYWPILADALVKFGVEFKFETPNYYDINWLRENKNYVDIIHLHYIQQFYRIPNTESISFTKFIKFILGLFYAKSLGYHLVYTFHNLSPTKRLKPHWIDSFCHTITIKISNKIIVHCNEAELLLKKNFGRRNGVVKVDHPSFIEWYPNSISKYDAREYLNLPQNSIIYLFFGGIRPNKGIELLIKAFNELVDEGIHLIIAGNIQTPKSYSEEIKELSKNNKNISLFLKKIQDDEVQLYLNASDIVVLPFRSILTSSSAHLAMSFKKPVIAPKMGCLPELIEPNMGWLFKTNQIESLAKALQLAATSDYNQYGVNGFRKMQLLSQEKFGKQTIEAYKK
jgi:glycosyltransferase involved in cell wall biosynthesis